MNRNFVKGLAAGLFLAFIAATFVIWLMVRDRKLNIPYGQNVMDVKMDQLQDFIDKNYLGEYDMETLYQGAYSGYIAGLGDKYSVYYSPEANEKLRESTAGSYVGIGAYIGTDEESGLPVISQVIEGAAAAKAGVLSGDIIQKVDGESVKGLTLDEVAAILKGEAGTEVTVTVLREGESIDYTITRRKVDVVTVYEQMLDDNIGYIQVTEFDSITVSQFDAAVTDLESQGMEGLVIDLRSNGGGVLNGAVRMCDRILPSDKVVTYTLDKFDNRLDYKTDDDKVLEVPIAILLNGGSASASEVFAGCLKDYNKAVFVGEKSFGKGIVQTLFALGDGSSVKLTTANYYSPNGINIQGTGFDPDIPAQDDPETENDEVLDAAVSYLLDQR